MLKIYVNETKCYLERGDTDIETELAEASLAIKSVIKDVSNRTNIPENDLFNKLIELT